MSVVATEPANGAAISASAQVLNSKLIVIDTASFVEGFGPDGLSPDPINVRDSICATPVNNLQGMYISVFHYPEYIRGGDITFPARINIEWRVVYQMPPDMKIYLPGFLTGSGLSGTGLFPDAWLPATSPMLTLPGIPVVYRVNCAGFAYVSVEFRCSTPGPLPLQEDLIAVQLAASQ